MLNPQAVLDELTCAKLELLTAYEDHMSEFVAIGAPEAVKDMLREETAQVLATINQTIEKWKQIHDLE